MDYMVMEAVAIKVQREDAEGQKQAERNQWKKQEMERLRREYG